MGRIVPPMEPGEITWAGDLPAPVTTYAAALPRQPLMSSLAAKPSTNREGSMVVDRKPRRDGLSYFYSYGGLTMPVNAVPTPGAGGVRLSAFQTVLVQLHDWVVNRAWFAAGYPRNLGYSFRVPQVSTKASGGPGPASMQQRPLFPKVQVVPRYGIRPATYPTRAAGR